MAPILTHSDAKRCVPHRHPGVHAQHSTVADLGRQWVGLTRPAPEPPFNGSPARAGVLPGRLFWGVGPMWQHGRAHTFGTVVDDFAPHPGRLVVTGTARVHELAREPGQTSRQVMSELQRMCVPVKGPSSPLEASAVRELRRRLGPGGSGEADTSPRPAAGTRDHLAPSPRGDVDGAARHAAAEFFNVSTDSIRLRGTLAATPKRRLRPTRVADPATSQGQRPVRDAGRGPGLGGRPPWRRRDGPPRGRHPPITTPSGLGIWWVRWTGSGGRRRGCGRRMVVSRRGVSSTASRRACCP